MKKARLVCERCGVDMNHHADKLFYPTDANDAGRIDSDLGGIVVEHHVCPECGNGETREA